MLRIWRMDTTSRAELDGHEAEFLRLRLMSRTAPGLHIGMRRVVLLIVQL